MVTSRIIVVSIALSVFVFSLPSFATECYTDVDCTMGNRCVKQGPEDKGTCREGGQSTSPGFIQHQNTGQPQQSPRDTKGKLCWSDKDCESGLECIMKTGQMYGTCR
jgi:hypothetical protein